MKHLQNLRARQHASKLAKLRTQDKTFELSHRSHKVTDVKTAAERAGVWAAGSLFLDDVQKLLDVRKAKLYLYWGQPDKETGTVATLCLQEDDKPTPEIIMLIKQGSQSIQMCPPEGMLESWHTLLDLHGVEAGLRWSHGRPIFVLADRLSASDFCLNVLVGQWNRRVVYKP